MNADKRGALRRPWLGFVQWVALTGGALIGIGCETSPPTGSVPDRLLKLTPQPEGRVATGRAPSGAESAGRTERGAPETRPPPRTPTKTAKPSAAPQDAGVEDESKSTAEQWASAAELKVLRGAVTRRVVDREPVPLTSLRLGPSSEPFIAFFELANASERPAQVVVTFVHESGKQVGFVPLGVPAQRERWRTWAETRRIQQAGAWRAVLTTSAGELVGQVEFTIAAAPEAQATQPAPKDETAEH